MPKYDVFDEALIDAPPLVVYKAILDEYAGITNWFLPILEFKLKGNMPIDREGAMVNMIAHSHGVSLHETCKITKLVEAKSIEMDYSGDFVGIGTWTFEPSADGKKTKMRFRWNVNVKKPIVVLLSPFVDGGKAHSEGMQKGFKACNSYLCKK